MPINSDRFWGHLLQEPVAFRRPDDGEQRHPDEHPEEKQPPGIREPVRAQGREPRRKSWRSCGHPPPHFHPVLSRIFGMQEGSPGTAQSFPADPPAIRGRSPQCLVFKPQTESGRKDSNLRLPGPKPGALTRLSYAPSQGPSARREKSTRNWPETSPEHVSWHIPAPPPHVPHRERNVGVDAMEIEKGGVEVELRRPVGIGGNHGRSPDRGYPLPLDPLWLTP